MTVKELIETLEVYHPYTEVYVKSPDNEHDYFIDRIHQQGEQLFLETAE